MSMFLSKAKSGIYQLYYKDASGKRQKVSTHTSSKQLALQFLRDFHAPARPQAEPQKERKTLTDFTGEFLAYAQGTYSTQTSEIYRRTLKNFCQAAGNRVLQDYSPRDIDLFKTRRLAEVRPVSVNMELRSLKAAFNTAVRWKLLQENPCQGVRLASVPEEAPVFLAAEEFRELLVLIEEPWLKEVVLFAALTGLRRGEIVHLRWAQVDLERRVLNIQSGGNFKTKKGKRRTVPLHTVAAAMLSAKVNQATDYVFTLNGKPLYEDWLTRLFKRYIRKSSIRDKRIHFHSLRHTFASWLVQHGSSLYEVQRLLGHASSVTTQVYSHLLADQMHGTVNKISVAVE